MREDIKELKETFKDFQKRITTSYDDLSSNVKDMHMKFIEKLHQDQLDISAKMKAILEQQRIFETAAEFQSSQIMDHHSRLSVIEKSVQELQIQDVKHMTLARDIERNHTINEEIGKELSNLKEAVNTSFTKVSNKQAVGSVFNKAAAYLATAITTLIITVMIYAIAAALGVDVL